MFCSQTCILVHCYLMVHFACYIFLPLSLEMWRHVTHTFINEFCFTWPRIICRWSHPHKLKCFKFLQIFFAVYGLDKLSHDWCGVVLNATVCEGWCIQNTMTVVPRLNILTEGVCVYDTAGVMGEGHRSNALVTPLQWFYQLWWRAVTIVRAQTHTHANMIS